MMKNKQSINYQVWQLYAWYAYGAVACLIWLMFFVAGVVIVNDATSPFSIGLMLMFMSVLWMFYTVRQFKSKITQLKDNINH